MKKVNLFFVYSAVISAVFVFSKCTLTEDIEKIKESFDDFAVHIATPEFNTGVHFEFVDAKTNEPISEKDVTVTITGKDAAKVYDNLGSKHASFSTNWGVLDLVIDPHQVDSVSMQSNPIQFEANVKVEGYLDVTQIITLTAPGQQSVVIALDNISNLPEGTIITEEKNIGTVSEFGLDETYEEEIDTTTSFLSQKALKFTSTTNNIEPSISISKGTQFFNRNGQALTGPINISYVIKNFPTQGTPLHQCLGINNEGLVPRGSVYIFANYGSVQLILNIMDKKFGKTQVFSVKNGTIKMNLFLPGNFINPKTKTNVNTNDRIIRLTQFDNTWYEDKVMKAGRRFYIEAALTKHQFVPQYWGHVIPTCHLNYSFKYDLNKAFPGSVSIITSTFKDNIFIGDKSSSFSVGNAPTGIYQDRRYGSPTGQTVVKFYSKDSDLIFSPQSITINNSCDNTAVYNVSVERKGGSVEWITADFNISLQSKSNNRISVAPNTTIYLKENMKSFMPVHLRGGRGVTGLVVGVQYSLRIQLSNAAGQAKIMVETEPSGRKKVTISDLTFGTTTSTEKIIFYSTTNNKLVSINYKVIVDDSILNQFK